MARLLPLLIVMIVGVVLMVARQAGSVQPRDGRTFRPRARSRRPHDSADARVVVLRRSQLTGLRDAYSGQPLDGSRPLVQCADCQSLFHAPSADVLKRENGGRCVSCGGRAFAAVTVIED